MSVLSFESVALHSLFPLEVIRSGFEPETHSLEGCCSIQLSYQTITFGVQRYE